MKKLLFSVVIALFAVSTSYAQSYMFVNTETVFKSMNRYNNAIKQLDDMAKKYTENIETAYTSIEEMYSNYESQMSRMSESNRNAYEQLIASKEEEVQKYQEDIFGQEGEMLKKRVEIIKPIQDSVFSIINKFAQDNGYTLILDVAANPTILYYSPALDKTEDIIKLVK